MHSHGTRKIKIHIFFILISTILWSFFLTFGIFFCVPFTKCAVLLCFYQLRAETASETLRLNSTCKITDDIFVPAQEFQIRFQILLLLITSLPPTVTYSVLQALWSALVKVKHLKVHHLLSHVPVSAATNNHFYANTYGKQTGSIALCALNIPVQAWSHKPQDF